jgi:hypothetical protein
LDRRAAKEAAERCGVPTVAGDGRASHLRRGWFWGRPAFGEKMLKLAERMLARDR